MGYLEREVTEAIMKMARKCVRIDNSFDLDKFEEMIRNDFKPDKKTTETIPR